MTGTDEASEPARPVLRIVRGDPTPEELAAVVAVLSAVSSAAAGATPGDEHRGQWRSRSRNIRPAVSRGPDAWRASGFPR